MPDFVSPSVQPGGLRKKLASISFPKLNRHTFKKAGTVIFILIVAFMIGGALRFVLSQRAGSTMGSPISPAKTVSVEREFAFPVYDKDKQLSDPIKYTVTTAQLAKTIVIKGQRATAVTGRTFLILNLKLVNDYGQSLFLNTRNYVRIQPAGTTDRLAPEIHNDTVDIQPLSTKLTRVALPVDENVSDFVLYVGEINGEKQEIPISF